MISNQGHKMGISLTWCLTLLPALVFVNCENFTEKPQPYIYTTTEGKIIQDQTIINLLTEKRNHTKNSQGELFSTTSSPTSRSMTFETSQSTNKGNNESGTETFTPRSISTSTLAPTTIFPSPVYNATDLSENDSLNKDRSMDVYTILPNSEVITNTARPPVKVTKQPITTLRPQTTPIPLVTFMHQTTTNKPTTSKPISNKPTTRQPTTTLSPEKSPMNSGLETRDIANQKTTYSHSCPRPEDIHPCECLEIKSHQDPEQIETVAFCKYIRNVEVLQDALKGMQGHFIDYFVLDSCKMPPFPNGLLHNIGVRWMEVLNSTVQFQEQFFTCTNGCW